MNKKFVSALICTTIVVLQTSTIPVFADSTNITGTSTVVTAYSTIGKNTRTSNKTTISNNVIKNNTTLLASNISMTPNIVVNSNYSGSDGAKVNSIPTYKTISAAVASIGKSNTSEKVIFVKSGTYHEKVNITLPNITLIGESAKNTKITYDAANALPIRQQDLAIVKSTSKDANGNLVYGTSGSASVTIMSTASNFKAANITFDNCFDESDPTYTSSNKSAVALRCDANQSTFVNCRITGNQDALLLNKNKQYYYKCYVEGDVDFIFGAAQAVLEQCEVHSLNRAGITPKGYVTAPSTLTANNYGFLFLNCNLTSDSGMNGQVYLGRPWQPNYPKNNCKVVYKYCNLGSHVEAAGWGSMQNTNKTTLPVSTVISYPKDNFMYEYKNTGTGVNTTDENRRQLTDDGANDYSKANVLSGWNFSAGANELLGYIGQTENVPDMKSDSTATNAGTNAGGAVSNHWSSTEFGSNTNPSRNTISVDKANNTVIINAGGKDANGNLFTGGKITSSQDGMSYYYTEIDPSKNFVLSANVKVNYFEKTNPDNQSGFGIMARDAIGTEGDSSLFTSNMCIVGGYNGAVESVFRNGVVDSSGVGAAMLGEHKFANRPANDGTATYKLTLKKTNTGYIASVDDGEEVNYCYPKQLEVLDKNHIYLGFFAARVASITVSNISLTETDAGSNSGNTPTSDEPTNKGGNSGSTPASGEPINKGGNSGNAPAGSNGVNKGNNLGNIAVSSNSANNISNHKNIKVNSDSIKDVSNFRNIIASSGSIDNNDNRENSAASVSSTNKHKNSGSTTTNSGNKTSNIKRNNSSESRHYYSSNLWIAIAAAIVVVSTGVIAFFKVAFKKN